MYCTYRDFGKAISSECYQLGLAFKKLENAFILQDSLFGKVGEIIHQMNDKGGMFSIMHVKCEFDATDVTASYTKFQNVMILLHEVQNQITNPDSLLSDTFDDISRYGKSIEEMMINRKKFKKQLDADRNSQDTRKETLQKLQDPEQGFVVGREKRIVKTSSDLNSLNTRILLNEERVQRADKGCIEETEKFVANLGPSLSENLKTYSDYQIQLLKRKLAIWKSLRSELG